MEGNQKKNLARVVRQMIYFPLFVSVPVTFVDGEVGSACGIPLRGELVHPRNLNVNSCGAGQLESHGCPVYRYHHQVILALHLTVRGCTNNNTNKNCTIIRKLYLL